MSRIQEELLAAVPALVADLLRTEACVRIRALGGSMFPAIRSGDVLSVRPCSAEAVETGAVVLFLADGRLFAHRLRAKRAGQQGWSLVTRGDSHWRDDPIRPGSELLGQVTAVERHGLDRGFHTSVQRRLYGLAVTGLTRWSRRAAALVKPLVLRGSTTNGEW